MLNQLWQRFVATTDNPHYIAIDPQFAVRRGAVVGIHSIAFIFITRM
jgi:hypothetical protein